MSYSFNVRAKTKAEALVMVAAKLDEVVEQQPIHAHDRRSVETHAETMLDLVGEPTANHELSVSVHGSCWQRDGVFGGVSAGVHVETLYITG